VRTLSATVNARQAPVSPAASTGAPVVLVHGAWVGEWCWAPVVELLEAARRPVHVVALTGLGSRRDEAGPHVTLGDHVADVVAVFDAHDLVDATLVGHSYGGRVITKAWPQLESRVRRMVYLDAHAPLGPGDEAGTPTSFVDDGSGMIPFAEFTPSADVLVAAGTADAFYSRLAPQSARTLSEPFRVELPASLAKTYVHATCESSQQFRRYAEAARDDSSWRFVEVPATHWLMLTHPGEVAAIILDPQSSACAAGERDEGGDR
jgi:pimeloyl-ACP methyl ester carboxylesterase